MPKYYPKVLLYHTIGEYDWKISVSKKKFMNQMKTIKRNGLKVYSVEEALKIFEGMKDFVTNSLIITFDDGYEDNYKIACLILNRFGYKPTIFISANYINKTTIWNHQSGYVQRILTGRQIIEMSKNGIEFGSHGLSHHNLVKFSRPSLLQEAVESKSIIEDIINKSVTSFAYPYGSFNEKVRNAIKNRYKIAFSVTEGTDIWHNDRYCIKRIAINNRIEDGEFEKLILRNG